MDTMEAIRRRRSIRRYKPDDIPDEVLDRLLQAVRLAPSGKNCQAWKFVVVRDKTMKSAVAATCQWRTAKGRLISQSWIHDAPIIIVGCGLVREAALRFYRDGEVYTANWRDLEAGNVPPDYDSPVIGDLAIALEHLVLAATAEGLGTCWIGGLNELRLKRVLGIPDEVVAPAAIVLGYPAEEPHARPRKSLDEIVCYDRYC